MKQTRHLLFAVLCALICTSGVFSQNDTERISAIRNESNLALKSYDI